MSSSLFHFSNIHPIPQLQKAKKLPKFPLHMASSLNIVTTLLLLILTCDHQRVVWAFKCTTEGATCNSVAGYLTPNQTTLSSIQYIFDVPTLRSLLAVNNLPLSTPSSHSISANQIVKIPFPCHCSNGTGTPLQRLPLYSVAKDDTLRNISRQLYSGLVTVEEIQVANNIFNQSLIFPGQKLWIPLPCSCDLVEGQSVVHYVHVVKPGSTLGEIAKQYDTTESTLLALNDMLSPKALVDNTTLDVPLKACTSKVETNSSDYPLLLANGTYALTAGDCVLCKCDAANSWTLQCEPSSLSPTTMWKTCPPMQCKGKNVYLGNTTFTANCNRTCSYAGYTNQTILTTLSPHSTCAAGGEIKKVNKSAIIIGVCSGIGALLLILGVWCFFKAVRKEVNKRRKHKFFTQNGGLLLQQHMSSSDGNVDKIKVFNSYELEKATDHYNPNRVLGQGGQGTVYKGMLSDGRIIAVKKSKIANLRNIEQFINEVVILSQINQRNVVKLLGCCLETEVPLLVYEYIPNGTLYQHIHNPSEDFPLTWEIRLRIAKEIAGALSYLHSAASMSIYHRDIKSTNILLDDKYRARVCDFGISISVNIDKTHMTTRVQGTFGYLDPEYFQTSQFTEKSDVYSFGVVLVELLTGHDPISSNETQELRGLAASFLQKMEEDCFLEMIDPRISNENNIEEIIMVAHLAKQCLHLNGRGRPTMTEIAYRLEGIRMMQKQSLPQENYEVSASHGIDLAEAYETYSFSALDTTNSSLDQ